MTRSPTLVAAFCAAAVVALLLSVAASSAGESKLGCTVLAAKVGILSAKLPKKVKLDATGRSGAGIDRLICKDLTGDGRKDMVASVFSGGTAGVEAWVVFRATPRGWKLVFRRLDLYRAGIRLAPAGIVEIDPLYAADGTDPNCCPSRGYDHTLYRWKSGKFVVGRTWHTRSP
ncbi:MAG TPA: hypothetical protein VF895_04355 [Gaiellaceae bacterium]